MERVFPDDHERRDATRGNTCGDFGKLGSWSGRGDTEELGTTCVRIPVVGNEETVTLLWAGTNVDEVGAERFGKTAGQKEFLVGLAARGNDGGSGAGMGLESLGGCGNGFLPAEGSTFHNGSLQTILAMEVGIIQPVRVRHPVGIHRHVLTRIDPVDLVLAAADDDIAASAAAGIDGLGLLEEPDAHLETEILGSQCADRTDIDRIQGVVAVEALAGVNGQRGVTAAIDEAEDIIVSNLFHEADASGAENAALVIENDPLADIDLLRFLDLVILEAGGIVAVLHGELLQTALAGLVADRTVERVIDQEELHDPLAAFFNQRRLGAHTHAFGNIERAGDRGAWAPGDDRKPIRADLGLAIRAHLGRAHLDEAHAAVAG